MKNITLTADDRLIEQARAVARSQHRTLNDAFREWLQDFVAREGSAEERVRIYDELMQRLRHVNAGRKFSREEMNER